MNSMVLRSTLLIALMVAAAFAGCTTSYGGDETPASIINDTCLGLAKDKCSIQDGRLHLQGLRLSPSQPAEVGLLVKDLGMPLVIDGFESTGTQVAIRIESPCDFCSVEIRRSNIDSFHAGIQVVGAAPSADLHVHDTRFRILKGSSDSSIDGHGIILDGALREVRLEDVRFDSASERGWALWTLAANRLSADGLSIERYGRGIVGAWTDLDLRDVVIDCVFDAVFVAHSAPQVHIDGLEVSGCAFDADCLLCTPAAVHLSGQGAETRSVVLRNLNLQGNGVGLHIQGFGQVVLSDFEIRDGLRGFGIISPDVSLLRGHVSGHSMLGADLAVGRAVVEAVEFHGNGHATGVQEGTRGGLRIMPFPAGDENPRTVRNSSFENNAVFGLITAYTGTVLDARCNWWGSPLGAAPWTLEPVGSPPVPGYGDAVTGLALTRPHLTSPPEEGTTACLA